MKMRDALSKAVEGFAVRHDGMQPGAYIYYEFNGWRIQFVHDDKKGSSSGWNWNDDDEAADWYVSDAKINVDAWPDLVQVNWDVEAAIDEIVTDEPISINKDEAAWSEFHRQ